jgi:hypothetical protein
MSSHILLNQVDQKFLKSGCIVEIGSARESDGPNSSTFYFNEIATKIGINFFSCDFSAQSHKIAKSIIDQKAFLCDGKHFLENMQNITKDNISLLYLDNFDVIYNETHLASLKRRVGDVYELHGEVITNQRSAEVHLEQMIAAFPLMAAQGAVIIDDTKKIDDAWWGKGALVGPFLLKNGFEIVISNSDGYMLARV